MQIRESVVNIGDKVKIVVDGKIKDLEVVDTSTGNKKKKEIPVLSPLVESVLGKKYPFWISVQLPDGRKMRCHISQAVI